MFDKAYVDYVYLWSLKDRGVSFVTRAKGNMDCTVKERLPKSPDTRILKDELAELNNPAPMLKYPGLLRRVTALVEIDGKEREMVFLINSTEWSRLQCLRPVQTPVAHQDVFRGTETDHATGGHRGSLRQRGQLEGPDSVACPFAFAVPGLAE